LRIGSGIIAQCVLQSAVHFLPCVVTESFLEGDNSQVGK
jgi:hypothetical protein